MASADRIIDLLYEARARPPGMERERFLAGACREDTQLKEEIVSLLEAEANEGESDFLKITRIIRPDILPTEKAGDRIGRYKLLEQIGEGGCGVVYMAKQEQPVRRKVALKVIKLGMDTRSVIARFEAERQALALMDHPNIAKVLDAGATGAGRPFFVMELVRGTKITDYCDQNHVSMEQRLELFARVCHAVQHAHQKGIIHRDLKPSNILVTLHDGLPVPKVIDFGIAKATSDQRLTDKTVFTAFEQFIGTPAYMSPEQAEMSGLGIDTRSDIYSLGVLLYELLTGRTPFYQRELMAGGLDEMRRTIREKEPPRPSTQLSTMEASALTATAQQRRTDAPRLLHVVRGDLDWIVMKCLEKDRSRRYETANALAADVECFLKNEPVAARPPSQLYLLQKMARRNRGVLVAGLSVMVALLLGVVALAVSNVRIRQERAQKETALFISLKSQALARRQSRQIGQRLDSLAAIREAAAIRRDADLRDAAIAALAVPDLRPGPAWRAYDTNDWSITFDADYKQYALIDNQSVISVHAVADNREIRRFPPGPAPQRHGNDRSFLFSPDSRLLAESQADNRWSIWRIKDAKLILRTPPASSLAFSFSGDSAAIALAIENSIVLFDLRTGEERKRWSFKHQPFAMAFSPDNRRLASGPLQSEVLSIFDVEHGQLVSELPVGASSVRAMAWHPSGKYLAVCCEERIQFWDVKAAAVVSVLQGHAQVATTLSFDPSGNWLISDSWDGTPRLWQPSPGREWIRFFSALNILKFSKDGRWAGVIYPGDGKAQLLEFTPSQVYHTFVGSLNDSQHSFSVADISPDGHLLALASSQGVSIRELPSGRDLAFLPVGYVRKVQFHPNGDELLISEDKGFEVWRITRHLHAPMKLQFGPSRHLALPSFSDGFALGHDGRTMAVALPRSDEARIIDLYAGTLRHLRFPHTNIDCVALSADGQLLATSGWQSTHAQLWNAQTGERLLNVTGERALVTFTPDGRELAISTPQAYTFYDVKTRKITRRFQRQSSMHPGWTAYSHDGKLMALELSPGVIRLCEVTTGRTVAHLQDPNLNVNRCMAFTPDGTQLIVAATYERAVHRWDLRAMRAELKAMGLDWDWPEFAAPDEGEKDAPALEVEVVDGKAR